MGCVKTDENYINIRVPKNFIESKYVQQLIDLVSIEEIAEGSTLSKKDAWALSEEIKDKWWFENKDSFISGK